MKNTFKAVIANHALSDYRILKKKDGKFFWMVNNLQETPKDNFYDL